MATTDLAQVASIPAGPTRVRKLVLGAACSLAVLTYVQRLGFVSATPMIQADLGLNDAEMGYVASAFLVAYGLFQVPGGLLADRLGGRHLLTLLVVGWSLLTGVAALAGRLPDGGWLPLAFLLVVRFLFGAFQAGGFPTVARALADWTPTPERGVAQGFVWTFSRLGGAGAPFLFLWLYRAFGGWAGPLGLMAGLGVLWCAAFWPWFRNRPGEMKRVNAAERELIESGRPARVQAGRLPWSCFLLSRNVWALCLMYGFVGFAGNFFTALLPVYLRGHRGLTDGATAWLSALPLAAGIVSCVGGGAVSDWLVRRGGGRKGGRGLVGCVGLVLAGLACLGCVWVQEVWLLALLLSLAFFGNDSTMGPAWAACADVGEDHAGTLSGAMNMTGAFFGATGMAIAGALLHRGLEGPMFVMFGCSYALASLCWLGVDATKPLVPKPRPAG